MISDDELRNIYDLASHSYFESHKPDMDFDDRSGLAGLRAVEAAARIDQAEIDTKIVSAAAIDEISRGHFPEVQMAERINSQILAQLGIQRS